MVQKKFKIKSKNALSSLTESVLSLAKNNPPVAKSPRADATEGITIDEIIESTGGLVTDLQPEDRLYMETVVDGEYNARATTVGAIVSKTMESVEPLVDELINAGKEVLYLWDVVDNGEDVDCSTIDASFNTIGFDRASDSSLKIFNIESSNIRYFVFYGSYRNYTTQSMSYFSIDLFSCNCQFFAKDITTPFFEHKATSYNYIALNGINLYLVKLRGYSSFIRFNNDLTQITEYFNTDEFFIPFSYDNGITTALPKIANLINIWQPTNRATGTVLSQTSYTYNSTEKTTFGQSYLLQYPIHTGCMLSIPKINLDLEVSIVTADLNGKSVFYKPDYHILTTPVAVTTQVFSESFVFNSSYLKRSINDFQCFTKTWFGWYGVSFTYNDKVFSKQEVYSIVGDNYQGNEISFYATINYGVSNPDSLYALTNVSFFDKFDDPIPTGYTPAKNN